MRSTWYMGSRRGHPQAGLGWCCGGVEGHCGSQEPTGELLAMLVPPATTWVHHHPALPICKCPWQLAILDVDVPFEDGLILAPHSSRVGYSPSG